jgi:hypothetical protein
MLAQSTIPTMAMPRIMSIEAIRLDAFDILYKVLNHAKLINISNIFSKYPYVLIKYFNFVLEK